MLRRIEMFGPLIVVIAGCVSATAQFPGDPARCLSASRPPTRIAIILVAGSFPGQTVIEPDSLSTLVPELRKAVCC